MWDERYEQNKSAYGAEANDFLVEVAEYLEGPVLCLAEGQGRNAIFLAKRGLSVLAVDQSAVGLRQARELAASAGVSIETQTCDLADFEFRPEEYGAIISIWAHMPPKLRARVHRGCVTALRPRGVMVLEAYTPGQLALATGGPPDAALCMSKAALEDELVGLDFQILRETERDVHEGRFHNGKSAVVQMLARRPG